MENNIISVMLWGEEVGKLYWDERSKKAVFNYHPNFIKKGLEIAPLTASVKGRAERGMPYSEKKRRFIKASRRFWQILYLTDGETWSLTNGLPRTIFPNAGLHR